MPEELEKRARTLWERGTEELLSGEVEAAIHLFSESLRSHPTAEAYTYRGWAYSFLGRYDEAIEECRKAIATDPAFGNPYNDIGSYLVAMERPAEAIEWFEKAKVAERYEPRHFPYLNLGRIYMQQGKTDEALTEFTHALALNPGDRMATAFLEKLKLKIN